MENKRHCINKIQKQKKLKKILINPKYKKSLKTFLFILVLLIIFIIEYYYINNFGFKYIHIKNYLNINNNDSFFNCFITDNITLVTGYFRIKSKHSLKQYYEWIKNFLQINRSMIFFIDKSFYKKIIYKRPKEFRNKTIWILTSIEDFYSYKHFYEDFKLTHEIDIEKKIHNTKMYLIWAEKSNFLKIGSLKNYFNSKCLYWVDVGSFRDKKKLQKYKNNWPSFKKCNEDGRVIMNQIKEFSLSKIEEIKNFNNTAHLELQKNYNVDGSLFGGQINYNIKFCELYYNTIKLFQNKKIFIGKDQNLYTYIAFLHSDIVKLVYSGIWFYLQKYLS